MYRPPPPPAAALSPMTTPPGHVCMCVCRRVRACACVRESPGRVGRWRHSVAVITSLSGRTAGGCHYFPVASIAGPRRFSAPPRQLGPPSRLTPAAARAVPGLSHPCAVSVCSRASVALRPSAARGATPQSTPKWPCVSSPCHIDLRRAGNDRRAAGVYSVSDGTAGRVGIPSRRARSDTESWAGGTDGGVPWGRDGRVVWTEWREGERERVDGRGQFHLLNTVPVRRI